MSTQSNNATIEMLPFLDPVSQDNQRMRCNDDDDNDDGILMSMQEQPIFQFQQWNMTWDHAKHRHAFVINILHVVCQREMLSQYIPLFLRNGADPNCRNLLDGCSALHYAASSLNVTALEYLLDDKRTDVNVTDIRGNTALHLLAGMEEHSEQVTKCVSVLLSHRDLAFNNTNLNGETAILIALKKKNKDTVMKLIYRGGVDLDVGETSDGCTARELILYQLLKVNDVLPEKHFNSDQVKIVNKLYTAIFLNNAKQLDSLLVQVSDFQQLDCATQTFTLVQTAAYHGLCSCLWLLIQRGLEFSLTREKQTVFHLLIDGLSNSLRQQYRQCFDFLLQNADKIDINSVDRFGNSPMNLAVIKGDCYITEKLIQCGAKFMNNLDKQNVLQLVIMGSTQSENDVDYINTFNLLLHHTDNFDIDQKDSYGYTALHRAFMVGNKYFVERLVENGAKFLLTSNKESALHLVIINSRHKENIEGYIECFDLLMRNLDKFNINLLVFSEYTALHLAAENGNPYFLQKLIDNGAHFTLTNLNETLLHIVLKSYWNSKNNLENFRKCFDILLKHTDQIDVNHQDLLRMTALHTAVVIGDSHFILSLLKHGAYINVENVKGEKPLDIISPSLLQDYFNSCISFTDNKCTQKSREINIDYTFFFNPDARKQEEGIVLSTKLPDSKLLQIIGQNKDLRHLLKHPLCTSFLEFKWEIVRTIFYLNLFLHCLFLTFITVHIFTDYNKANTVNGTMEDEHILYVDYNWTWWMSVLPLVAIIFREIVQLTISLKYYIYSLDNWVELLLILSGSSILIIPTLNFETKKILSAITVLFSWVELVVLVGQIRRVSSDIEMLKTVSLTLLRFLTIYSGLIVAFALSLYLLSHDRSKSFESPGRAMFSTLIMMIGEYELGDNYMSEIGKLNMWVVVYYVIFVMFILLMTVALFNLLVGLAVSDTRAIRDDADLIAIMSRIRNVIFIESIASHYPLCCNSVFSKIGNLCLPKHQQLKKILKGIKVTLSLTVDRKKSIISDKNGYAYRISSKIFREIERHLVRSRSLSEIKSMQLEIDDRLNTIEECNKKELQEIHRILQQMKKNEDDERQKRQVQLQEITDTTVKEFQNFRETVKHLKEMQDKEFQDMFTTVNSTLTKFRSRIDSQDMEIKSNKHHIVRENKNNSDMQNITEVLHRIEQNQNKIMNIIKISGLDCTKV